MASEKDNLGQQLHDAEAALEDQWARQYDAELLEQIRKKSTSTIHCLICGKTLHSKSIGQMRALVCPEGHGAWVDQSTLNSISNS